MSRRGLRSPATCWRRPRRQARRAPPWELLPASTRVAARVTPRCFLLCQRRTAPARQFQATSPHMASDRLMHARAACLRMVHDERRAKRDVLKTHGRPVSTVTPPSAARFRDLRALSEPLRWNRRAVSGGGLCAAHPLLRPVPAWRCLGTLQGEARYAGLRRTVGRSRSSSSEPAPELDRSDRIQDLELAAGWRRD